MLVTAYHASPDLFDVFVCTEQGVHLGSVESALQAIRRKVSKGDIFYLYKVEVNTTKFIEEFDRGFYWNTLFSSEPECVEGYIYMNRYEPSTKPSYVTWKPEKTLRMIDVSQRIC